MEINPLKEEIEYIVQEIKKVYKKTLRQMSIEMRHGENYVSVEKSKGNNKTFLEELKKYQMELAERAKDPAPQILEIVKELKSNIDAIRKDVADIKQKLDKK